MLGERMLKKIILLGTALLILGACTSKNDGTVEITNPASPPTTSPPEAKAKKTAIPTLIRSDYQADEITSLCSKAVDAADKKFKELSQLPAEKGTDERDFNNTRLVFENTLADLGDATTPLVFMGYVSTSENLRSEGINCEERVNQFRTEIFSRKDLFSALKDAQGKLQKRVNSSVKRLKPLLKVV